MNPAVIDQARKSANRTEALAGRLASLGSLDAAEICAGAAMTIRLLAAALEPAADTQPTSLVAAAMEPPHPSPAEAPSE